MTTFSDCTRLVQACYGKDAEAAHLAPDPIGADSARPRLSAAVGDPTKLRDHRLAHLLRGDAGRSRLHDVRGRELQQLCLATGLEDAVPPIGRTEEGDESPALDPQSKRTWANSSAVVEARPPTEMAARVGSM